LVSSTRPVKPDLPSTRKPEAAAIDAPSATASAGTARRAVVLLALVIVLWGANWPAMKVGLDYIPPLWFAAARVLLGCATLFAVLAAIGRMRLPHRSDLPVIASIGLLQVAGFLALVNLGLQTVEAGRSAILAYTPPLWIAPLAFVFLRERLGGRKLAALAFGALGLGILFSPLTFDPAAPGAIAGNGLLLGAAAAAAVSIVHVRGHRWQGSALQLMPWAMLLAGAALAGLAAVIEPVSDIRWTGTLAVVLAYNGPVASGFCFWAFVTVQRTLPAVTTAIGSQGVPVAGMLFSAVALSEALTAGMLAGFGLIAAGVAVLAFGYRRPESTDPASDSGCQHPAKTP